MSDIIEFGLMDVIEERDGVTFSLSDEVEEVFCDRTDTRELLKFLSAIVSRWDQEWN